METNPGLRRPVPDVCTVLCSNERAWLWTLVAWRWRRLRTTYCCALRLLSQICITCRSCWFQVLVALSCCIGAGCLNARGMGAYVRNRYGAFSQPIFECGYSAMLLFRICGVRQNFYMFSLTATLTKGPDFWLFTNINGCRVDCGCACLFHVCGWSIWPSSGLVVP